uniref:Uncharacterized protein n=1 Tax=Lepeophtheirus salmonis TaxID=72036 RepID=A0A0K2VA57_LEPSM
MIHIKGAPRSKLVFTLNAGRSFIAFSYLDIFLYLLRNLFMNILTIPPWNIIALFHRLLLTSFLCYRSALLLRNILANRYGHS